MTEEKNVGRFENLMIRVIQLIIAVYLASAQSFIELNVPVEIALIFLFAVVGYFINRFVLKWEDYVNNFIMIQRMKAEQEKQKADYEIRKAESKKVDAYAPEKCSCS